MAGQVLESLESILKPENDRQVGLGMLGLANFLANNNITYAEFGKALEAVNNAESLTKVTQD